MASQERFVSILSDFGFKRTFGNQNETLFLKKALEILIKSDEPIREVSFDNTVKTPLFPDDRGAVFDVNCIDEKGRSFLVEMQRTELKSFIHRSKFYAYLHLNEMIERGGRIRFNNLRPIYTIAVLDGIAFPNSPELHQHVCLRNQHGELIDEQITHVLLELGKWNKSEEEIVSDLDILILLMKFTETATVDTPTPEILVQTGWAEWVMEQLERKDLNRSERLFFRKQQAKIGYYETLDEMAAEEKAQLEQDLVDTKQKLLEVEQKTLEAQQKATEAQQKVIDAEQKATEAQQKVTDAEQKVITTTINLLKEGSFTDEKIAALVGISIAEVQAIKKQIK